MDLPSATRCSARFSAAISDAAASFASPVANLRPVLVRFLPAPRRRPSRSRCSTRAVIGLAGHAAVDKNLAAVNTFVGPEVAEGLAALRGDLTSAELRKALLQRLQAQLACWPR
jgi:hypothetical protein